jgi:hypothetical protein
VRFRSVNSFSTCHHVSDNKLSKHEATTLPAADARAVGRSPLTGEADECSLAQDATRGVVSSS